jgi:hypothetical protein
MPRMPSSPAAGGPPPLEPGARLGRYRLESPLGQGGMGVVWRARDSSLDRAVAIKLLPAPLAHDPERLARLEREARMLAALNHPHIAAIYGIESDGEVRFLVLELVAGETLAARIAGGAMPADEVARAALQIAGALESAHERGIIHRDLKPQNIQVDPDGNVKLLDFGLARAFAADEGGGVDAAESPTISARMTGADVILGTAAYMSPEQARGRTVDRRADIWAFGVVLFEMLIGGPLFRGETVTDTLASVLRMDVPWDRLPAGTPPALVALLRRCLERDPRLRLRDIGEARITLERLVSGEAEPAPRDAASPPHRRTAARMIAGLAAALAVGGLLGWLARPPKAEAPAVPRRFQLRSPAEGPIRSLAIAPDGRSLAYVAGDRLWIHALDRLEPRVVLESPDLQEVFWSPDAKWIGLLVDSRIERVSPVDGTREVVARTNRSFPETGGASWREDGTIVATHSYENEDIFAVPAAGGDHRTVLAADSTKGESDFHDPSMLPGDRAMLFVSHRLRGMPDRIELVAGSRRRVLVEMKGERLSSPVYSPSGHILFERRSGPVGVWALPFSLSRLSATGPPFLVAAGASLPSVAKDGTLVSLERRVPDLQLAWVDRTGALLDTIGTPSPHHFGLFDLSPDEGRIVVTMAGENALSDLWIHDLHRRTTSRLTFDPWFEGHPVWSPSGRRIVYQVTPQLPPLPDHPWASVIRNADGTGPLDTLQAGGYGMPVFLPDERHLVFSRVETFFTGMLYAASTPGAPLTELPLDAKIVYGMRPSPDGRYLAYVEGIGEDIQSHRIFLRRFGPGEGRWLVSPDEGLWPRWNARGDRLYYVRGDDLMEVAIELGETPTISTPVRLFTRPASQLVMAFNWTPQFSVAGDGGRFVILQPALRPGSDAIVVSQNWQHVERP